VEIVLKLCQRGKIAYGLANKATAHYLYLQQLFFNGFYLENHE